MLGVRFSMRLSDGALARSTFPTFRYSYAVVAAGLWVAVRVAGVWVRSRSLRAELDQVPGLSHTWRASEVCRRGVPKVLRQAQPHQMRPLHGRRVAARGVYRPFRAARGTRAAKERRAGDRREPSRSVSLRRGP